MVLILAAWCGNAAGIATARDGGEPVTPRPVPSPGLRISPDAERATGDATRAGGARAVGEVGYPRTAAEAEALGGQALLLVTVTARRIGDATVQRATLHFEDGAQADLLRLTAQTNDVDDDSYRHDALFFIPLATTGTKAHVSATFGGRTEVVARFPRPPTAYPRALPVLKPGVPASLAEVGVIARGLYPFFRTAPLRSPGAESTCALHVPTGPPVPARVKALKKPVTPPPGTGPGTATAQGSLDKELIRGVIRAHIAEVQACYERELWTDPKLSARMMVQFTIAADGWVIASVLQSSNVENKRLNDCVVAVVRCWRFPNPADGGIVIVSYPFVLRPASTDE
jgi:hypothetical protein